MAGIANEEKQAVALKANKSGFFSYAACKAQEAGNLNRKDLQKGAAESSSLEVSAAEGEFILETRGLKKHFQGRNGEVEALRGVDIRVSPGQIYGIIGLSGAGKSTLIRCLNLLERPDEGKVFYHGCELQALSEEQLRQARRKIGMIFQDFNLFSAKTVGENISFPLRIAGWSKNEAEKKARALLQRVDLPDKWAAYPEQLSGGQKQRIAIARALVNDPDLLLLDEATSALDPQTTEQILALLKSLQQERKLAMIFITHQMKVVESICERAAVMENGKIIEENEVAELFRNPRSETTRRLILPQGKLLESEKLGPTVRLTFDGHKAEEAIFAELVLASGLPLSILAADSTAINGISYGQMLVLLPDGEEARNKISDWLCAHDIQHEFQPVEKPSSEKTFQSDNTENASFEDKSEKSENSENDEREENV